MVTRAKRDSHSAQDEQDRSGNDKLDQGKATGKQRTGQATLRFCNLHISPKLKTRRGGREHFAVAIYYPHPSLTRPNPTANIDILAAGLLVLDGLAGSLQIVLPGVAQVPVV